MAGFVVLPPHPSLAASVRRLFSALFNIFRSGPRQAAGRRRMLQGVLFGLEIFKCLLHFLQRLRVRAGGRAVPSGLSLAGTLPPCPPPPTLDARERGTTTGLQGGTAPCCLYSSLAEACSNCGLLKASRTQREAPWGDACFP